jgi:hypothetical protein
MIEKILWIDHLDTPILDIEGMTRTTVMCDNGHWHSSLPVAKGLDYEGTELSEECGVVLDSGQVCRGKLFVRFSIT